MSASEGSYSAILSERLAAGQRGLAQDWLARLIQLLPVDARDVFPSDKLLDHIPTIIEQIAAYIRAPEEHEFAANTVVIEKAQQLGRLRHEQQASVHQILREYALLGTVLETFIVDVTRELSALATPLECFQVMRRVGHAIQTLMQTTVDTFVGEYTETITRQTDRLANFNRMVSHELRNPLSTLQYTVHILANTEDGEVIAARPRLVSLMERGLGRMGDLLRSLEALSRARDGTDTPNVQLVELGAIARDVARQLTDMAAARGVAIRIVPDLPSVTVDVARLELVLMNLVSNAVKYSDPAKAERFVEIDVVPHPPAADAWTLRVRDNGLGIPQTVLPQLLHTRFLRAHAQRDQELGNEGAGLGLSIVQACVESLGGKVTLSSVESDGTTVLVTLPQRS